ncbi:hypothetical protein ACDA63_16360 [Uliginosibacterium sp. sgz301328]|uniref:hypothetical protein n=1 Tax=Uliginosibacterium sp. sgz301328 TaxID=3243764 RepID=UPI00359E8FCA
MNHVKALLAFIVSACLLIALAGHQQEKEEFAGQQPPVKATQDATGGKPVRMQWPS